jgi:cytoskeletal protein RodZ
MALSGELSDLSLAELIEFFCNQRKSGRLKLIYSIGPGYFYLQAGSVVHARIGSLRGIEAVYYALTLPNASFTFSPAFDAPEHTINQPWTSVVLEGLRRMDEGVEPGNPFLEHDDRPEEEESDPIEEVPLAISYNKEDLLSEILSPPEVEAMGDFLSRPESESHWMKKPWTVGAVFAAVALIVGVVGVPWGLYARSKAAKLANEAKPSSSQPASQSAATNQSEAPPAASETSQPMPNSDAADLAAKRQREERAKERAKAQDAAKLSAKDASVATATAPKSQSSPASGAKKITVQVTYDENGRVTQASGGDATALRIARQKRFPAGKAGSATITIPIN